MILPGVKDCAEVGFVCPPHHTVLGQPFTLTMLLDAIERAIADLVPRAHWRDDRIAAVINAVFDDCVTPDLRSVGRCFGVSPRYLIRAFMNATGISLGRYLNTGLVQIAAFLLQHTETKLDEVATAVGFQDASHMSRAFLHLTGRRPGQFRAKVS